ncbi:MAG: NosD domain-containing protein, partial [Archaeoglobaceae archaeon]|nr:NosD domain-containing protein [Archaeoglobaceae archaeon]
GEYSISKDLSGLYGNNYYCIKILANNVTLEGNGKSMTGDRGYGLLITASNVTVKNLTISKYERAIYLDRSNNNNFTNITINGGAHAIYLDGSNNNNFSKVTVVNSMESAVYLSNSNKNSLTELNFTNSGVFVHNSINNTLTGNVNGKPLIYLENERDKVFENAGQVILVNCTNITVRNSEMINATVGLMLWKTNDSIFENIKTAENSYHGI